jgi:hypothetical protein
MNTNSFLQKLTRIIKMKNREEMLLWNRGNKERYVRKKNFYVMLRL